eukprot:TRINITY_DN41539_c0_g1_i1.p1 TRINITY_DN41539_c0_g1~~TRINITY_DN41539_c0_g1_i1.p1  ORF type:complete len:174 (+),score=26.73 TRINITY_DN41539_c0_g1_i1:70-522(+)
MKPPLVRWLKPWARHSNSRASNGSMSTTAPVTVLVPVGGRFRWHGTASRARPAREGRPLRVNFSSTGRATESDEHSRSGDSSRGRGLSDTDASAAGERMQRAISDESGRESASSSSSSSSESGGHTTSDSESDSIIDNSSKSSTSEAQPS